VAVNQLDAAKRGRAAPGAAKPQRGALARLLQGRRESAGYSRARIGELVGLSQGTIEGWEVGRVRSPAVHDVLRLAHFLQIPFDEIQRAVFDDGGEVATINDFPAQPARKPRTRRAGSPAQLLEAAFRLFGWDDANAANALATTPSQIRRWRSGAERMELADFVALSSMIGLAAAEAMRGGESRTADVKAAAEILGVSLFLREDS
jgi:transcriptional regulator with XRE-family HTH domain